MFICILYVFLFCRSQRNHLIYIFYINTCMRNGFQIWKRSLKSTMGEQISRYSRSWMQWQLKSLSNNIVLSSIINNLVSFEVRRTSLIVGNIQINECIHMELFFNIIIRLQTTEQTIKHKLNKTKVQIQYVDLDLFKLSP